MPKICCDARRVSVSGKRGALDNSDAAKGKRAVRSTKTEGIRQRSFDRHFTRFVSGVIEITFRILIENVDRRRCDLILDCKRREYRLDPAGGAQ